MTHWVFDFEKIFREFVIPPCQRPTRFRPSPAPSNPAPPRRPGTAHPGRVPSPPAAPRPSGSGSGTRTRAPSGSGSGTAPSGSGYIFPVFRGSWAPHPVGQGSIERPGEFPGKPGNPGTQWVRMPGFAGAGDKIPFSRAPDPLFFTILKRHLFFGFPKMHPLNQKGQLSPGTN